MKKQLIVATYPFKSFLYMYRYVKRVLDIICAILGIIVSSPFWLIAVVGILIADGGPVLYTSTRIGKGNKPFCMLKFRSMRVEKGANELSLRPNKDRIFTFGKFLRKTKIDELPQLLNVLNGTMSIIGPRPVSKDQYDLFRTGKWNNASEVRVGLSGLAALYDTIYGEQFTDEKEYMEKVFPTRRELEYVYVNKMSFCYDVKIVLWTIVSIVNILLGKTPIRILDKLIKESSCCE